jgi:hypothetical protein
MRGHVRGTRGVAIALAIALVGLFGTMGTAHAEGDGSLFLSSTVSPTFVTAGSETLWTVTIENDSGGSLPATVDLSTSGGSFNLTTMKTLDGNICATSAPKHVVCDVPPIEGGASFDLQAVVTTKDVTAPATIFLDASASAPDESSASIEDQFDVGPATGTSTSTYIPPGGSANVGGKKPTEGVPTVVTLKVPKKEVVGGGGAAPLIAAATTLQSGPGAPVTMTSTPCDASCKGSFITISDFPGYNDPTHPLLATVQWLGSSIFGATTLEIVSHDTVINPTKCVKVKGSYTNHPCIVKESINKKTGNVTDVIAFLSGDPLVRRK